MKHYGHQVYKGIFEISEQPQFLTTESASLPSWHGTYNGYCRHRCRCKDCKKANAEYHRELRKRKRGDYCSKQG